MEEENVWILKRWSRASFWLREIRGPGKPRFLTALPTPFTDRPAAGAGKGIWCAANMPRIRTKPMWSLLSVNLGRFIRSEEIPYGFAAAGEKIRMGSMLWQRKAPGWNWRCLMVRLFQEKWRRQTRKSWKSLEWTWISSARCPWSPRGILWSCFWRIQKSGKKSFPRFFRRRFIGCFKIVFLSRKSRCLSVWRTYAEIVSEISKMSSVFRTAAIRRHGRKKVPFQMWIINPF